MYRLKKPLTWFDNKVKTKDDLQFISIGVLISFLLCTKCYMAFSPEATAKTFEYKTAQHIAAPTVSPCCQKTNKLYMNLDCCGDKSILKCCSNTGL
jgi:hypothetical protein